MLDKSVDELSSLYMSRQWAPNLVVIESPFASPDPDEWLRFRHYTTRAVRDSFSRGEFPFASHLMYPGALDDDSSTERWLGMNAGFSWGRFANLVAVYTDLGISSGMARGIQEATRRGQLIDYREIGV